METAPAGIFLPLAVLLALGLISTDSSSSRQVSKYNNYYVTTEITVNAGRFTLTFCWLFLIICFGRFFLRKQ